MLPPPSDTEVVQITERIALRIMRLLKHWGLGPNADPDEADPLSRDQPLLAELYTASVQGRIAIGPQAGNYLATGGFQPEPVHERGMLGPRCANVSGFSLHANVCIPAKARHQLENLCRYAARPAVATERLSILHDGRVSYRLRHKWRNGATHVISQPLDLVAKLAALVPPPRFNLVGYHGILAPAARWRSCIVPSDSEVSDSGHYPAGTAEKQGKQTAGKDVQNPSRCHGRNYCWSELLKRVFEIDVLECPRCGGRMRILCAINPPDAMRKILECLGLPSRAPPIFPAVQEEDCLN